MSQGEMHHRIPVADGLTLFAREIAPEGAASGLPVLCLHGLTRNSLDFEDLLPQIAGLGRRAIALDVRGRGQSDRDPDPARYTPAVYAGDVLAVLKHLGIEKAAFVGTSMGGIITMIVAAMAPQVIERAVLNDIGPVIDPKGLARIQGYVGQSSGPASDWDTAADRIWAINGHAFPKAPPSFFYRMAKRTFRATPEGLELNYDPAIAGPVRGGGAAPADMWPLFEALKPIPTLVVRGALSDLLAAETVAEMKARKPDLEAVEVPDVGHAPILDEPAAISAVMRFLAG